MAMSAFGVEDDRISKGLVRIKAPIGPHGAPTSYARFGSKGPVHGPERAPVQGAELPKGYRTPGQQRRRKQLIGFGTIGGGAALLGGGVGALGNGQFGKAAWPSGMAPAKLAIGGERTAKKRISRAAARRLGYGVIGTGAATVGGVSGVAAHQLRKAAWPKGMAPAKLALGPGKKRNIKWLQRIPNKALGFGAMGAGAAGVGGAAAGGAHVYHSRTRKPDQG